MADQDLLMATPHIPIESDKQTSIPPPPTESEPQPPRVPNKPQPIANRKHDGGLTRYEKVRSLMLLKSEALMKELDEEQLSPPLNNEFSNRRRKNRLQIYKYLLLGYQEIVKQWDIKRMLKQPQDNDRIVEFIHNAASFEQVQVILKQKAIEIENKILQYHNTSGSLSKESKKYSLQMGHFLASLGDVENRQFRENIVIGAYDPDDIACMSFIDMLDRRKKMYIFTKTQQLLNYQHVNAVKNRRHEAYEQEIIRKNRNKRKQAVPNANQNIEQESLQYFLSNKLIQKLEIELMEIPMKNIRKAALSNLKRVFE